MPSAQIMHSSSPPTLPMNVPGKGAHYTPLSQPAPYHRPSVSPPQAGSSVNASAVPSLTSGSYAGSAASDYEQGHGTSSGVDLLDMLNDRLATAVNPLPLDRSMARQAQTSGELNAKQRELLELQALAQRRLKGTRANFADGMKAAKEVKKDLEWTQKRVNNLKAKAERKYPKQYAAQRVRFPSPVDN